MRSKKGFTLVEMLVVIAIIAILVAIIIPVVNDTTRKAKASADAANLRVVLGELNVQVVDGQKTVAEILSSTDYTTSKYDPDAVLYAVYEEPGFVAVYYVNGSTYYSLDYLADVATNGESSLSTAKPSFPNGTWYMVGG